MQNATMENKVTDAVRALKIIDVDTHLSEPHDLWTRRAPAKMRERVPQVKMHNGRMSWVIDGDQSIGYGAAPSSVILKDGSKARSTAFKTLTMDDVHPASALARPRLQVMDSMGVWAQVVYPNLLGF